MNYSFTKWTIILVFSAFAFAGFRKTSGIPNSPVAGARGIHFKIGGKQYDIAVIRGIYVTKSKTFAIFNAALPGFPDTTITLSIGSDFTGTTGTFKGDADKKGAVFGFILYAGNFTRPLVGYGAGQNDSSTGETVANTPISITITSFDGSGSIAALYGNVTAQGTFSGTAYDLLHKVFVPLTDGSFNVHP